MKGSGRTINSTSRSCGQALIEVLERFGVDTVFGIPGVHTLEYYRALSDSEIRTVLTRHEQGAAFMADGYARATGRVGVSCVITGPGLANAATAIAQAYSDSIPTLTLTTVNRSDSVGRGWGELHESVDQLALARSVAARAEQPQDASDAPPMLAALLEDMVSGRPRPAVLQVPIDLLAQRVTTAVEDPSPTPVAAPYDEQVEEAAHVLQNAARPCILIGGGAVAASSITALAERLAAPVITTTAAKGVVPESHPLSIGSSLARPEAQAWLRERDAILAIGTELAETDTWSGPLGLQGTLIRVDLDPERFTDLHGADLPVLADAEDFAVSLVSRVAEASAGSTIASHDDVARLRESILRGQSDLEVRLGTLLDALRAALPGDVRVFTDMTQIAYTGNYAFTVDLPRRWFHPVGYGSLGYAVPAAIGGSIGSPEVRTVALVGDAGLLYTVQELATAAELRIPLTVVLWNNAALGQIRDDMLAGGIPPTCVEPVNPDFGALAQAFGLHYESPRNFAGIPAAVARAVDSDGPALVELNEAELFAR